MADVARIRVGWSGTGVTGPGVSTFYLASSVTAGWPAALKTFFTAIKAAFPDGLTWTIPDVADVLHEDTGVLYTSNAPGGGGVVVANGGAGDYKPGVGIRIRWGTAGVVGGRRVVGTTFLCPLLSGEFPKGVIQASSLPVYLGAANAYRNTAGIQPIVYSPPREARTYKGHTLPARVGTSHPITSAAVPSAETWLRSRRI